MKVVLVRPPVYSIGLMGPQLVPVLGVAYVAAAARTAGHDVRIVDMCGEALDRTEVLDGGYVAYGLPVDALAARIADADVVGFTCMFSQDWTFHRDLMRAARAMAPKAVFVAGGEHITAVPEYCLQDCRELDACVIGEGEAIFVDFLEVCRDRAKWAQVAGLVFRDPATDAVRVNDRRRRIEDVDSLPLPAWDLVPVDAYLSRELNYHMPRGRTLPMLASRGCPYKCTFCSNSRMWGNPWRHRDPKLVVDEMEAYVKRYGVSNFVFSDLTAVIQKEKMVALCREIIGRGLKITWQLPTLRTESLDREVMALMYQAGCRELDFAIESASETVLEKVGKRNHPAKMASLIREGLRLKINFSCNIVLGLPGEGLRDMLKTYGFVLKLAVAGMQELNVFPFVPYPGSRLFFELVESGKLRLDDHFFKALFSYADLSGSSATAGVLKSKRSTNNFRVLMMASFYAVSFLTHPWRIVRLIMGLCGGRVTSKLQGVLLRIIKNVRATRRVRKEAPDGHT